MNDKREIVTHLLANWNINHHCDEFEKQSIIAAVSHTADLIIEATEPPKNHYQKVQHQLRLYLERKGRGTAARIAEDTGISPTNLSRFVKAKTGLNPDNFSKLVDWMLNIRCDRCGLGQWCDYGGDEIHCLGCGYPYGEPYHDNP